MAIPWITNGLPLTRDLPWLAATCLDRVKASLHYFSGASISAGKPGDIATIKAGWSIGSIGSRVAGWLNISSACERDAWVFSGY